MITEGRTFVVSGGASGLGRATVQRLFSNGAYVAVLDVREDKALTDELGRDRARFFQVDVSETDSVAEAVKSVLAWIRESSRPIGGVICCAGVGHPGKIIDRQGTPLSLSAFDFVVNINLRGTIDLIRQLLPVIVQNEPIGPPDEGDGERAVLVLVSSVAAFEGQPGQLAYSASKGAIASLTLPLARDLAPYGVRVVTIAPGVFESRMTSLMSDKVRKSLESVMEFPKRMGKADEFAQLVKEVISNRMLNGTVLRLDAGVRMPSKM